MTNATLNLSNTTTRSRGRPLLVGALSALLGGVLATGYAMGQADTLDADGDGMISYSEILVAMPDMTQEEFLALDSNADGLLDGTEIAAAEQAGLITTG